MVTTARPRSLPLARFIPGPRLRYDVPQLRCSSPVLSPAG